MNVLIIEDEEVAYNNLRRMLTTYDPSIHIIAWFKSIRKAVEWFSANNAPDIVFLDIKLTDGLSFEIFTHIEINAPIIFTTAYHEYAIKAFEVNSVDYLLKPFSQNNLEKSIEKVKKYHLHDHAGLLKKIKDTVDSISLNKSVYKNRFLVKIGDKLLSISTDEIAYFYRDELVMLVSKQDKKYAVNYSLDELENMLEPEVFFRINRQFLVNIKSVKMVQSYFSGKLKVELIPPIKMDIIISQEKASSFKNWMDGN